MGKNEVVKSNGRGVNSSSSKVNVPNIPNLGNVSSIDVGHSWTQQPDGTVTTQDVVHIEYNNKK